MTTSPGQPSAAAFSTCISQFGNGAYLASEYIGGLSVTREFKGSERRAIPSCQRAAPRQREALSMLVDQILSDKAFPVPLSVPACRKLITESWQDSRFSYYGGSDYPIYRMILNIQEIVLDQCLDSSVLQRIQNQALHRERYRVPEPLKIAEIFRSLSDERLLRALRPGSAEHGARSPFPRSAATFSGRVHQAAEQHGAWPLEGQHVRPGLPLYRLLRQHGVSGAPDARTWHDSTSDELGQKIDKVVGQKDAKIDDTSLAHLKEIRHRVDRVLKANLNANEP